MKIYPGLLLVWISAAFAIGWHFGGENSKAQYIKGTLDGCQSCYSNQTQDLIKHDTELTDIVAEQLEYEKKIVGEK